MKNRFPLAVLMLSASPFILAQEVKPISSPDQPVALAQATGPDVAAGPEEIQKVIIVSTGSRGAQRSLIDTAVPIDILSSRELNKTGQSTLDKAMQYRVPSFNTVQTPVNDATSLLDPYEIRNMGPSRVLILINGKRKNASSLIYTQTSPGRGESGADISSIPTDAIKRIEVLRDGASAQYGSDAIAGVVNIILKDNPEGGSVIGRGGVTHEGDGENAALSLNHGVPLGDNGFINYTLEASKTKLSNRPGIVNAKGEASDFGADLNTQVLPFLAKYPDARNINGAPQTEAAKGVVNARYDLGNGMAIYGNAGYFHKKVDSFANYRTPYWRPTDYGLLHAAGTPYEGYGPTFIGKLDDYNATGGIKGVVAGWNTDLSLTYGGNEQKYNVTNTVNRGMEDAVLAGTSTQHSPTSFAAGGVKFEHWVLNGDISKQITPAVNVYAGTELRHENYEVKAGEPSSYILGGADSYAGNDVRNSFPVSRSNYGVYGGASWDITDRFMIDGTGRYEKYTDFGSAFVWKAASRFKVNEQITVRGSASTGFRAPSLAQTFTQKAQYSFVAGSGIQVSGLVNNVSPEAKALQVPALKAEKSDNFTVGLGLQPDSNTSITVDYYNIKVKNRIVLGKEIKPICDVPAAPATPAQAAAYNACVAASPLDTVMVPRGLVSLSFFVNALTSRTTGIDYVLSRKNIPLGEGKVTLNLSGNYSLKNERQGEVNNPTLVANAHQSVLDATQEALMFTSRPKFKTIFGADLDYQKISYSLNNTVFGPTRFRNAGLDDNLQVAFKTKVVSDFGLNYQFNKSTTFTLNVNNIFNVTPKWHFNALNPAGQAILDSKVVNSSGLTPTEVQTNLVTFNGRYSMVTYDGSQFSQLGRIFAASLNYRF